MNTKKILSSISILAACATLFAQSSKEIPQQFSSFGSEWIELDLGATIYSVSDTAYPTDEAGFSLKVKTNSVIIESDGYDKIFGMDLGFTFAYDNLFCDGTHSGVNVDVDANVLDIALELKPYIWLVNEDKFSLKGFINPFISYAYMNIDVGISMGNISAKAGLNEEAFCYGVRVGLEFSFLDDFYVAPAYRYLRTEPTTSSASGQDLHSAELEIGYRLTRDISLHFSYSYVFDGDPSYMSEVELNKLMLGARYTF